MKIFLILLSIHFVADFVFQSDWMATNKSKNITALLLHTYIYSICFFWLGSLFMFTTFLTHSLTDAVTSRITTKLWAKNQRHWFFVMIGFDQLLHFYQLFLTWQWTIK